MKTKIFYFSGTGNCLKTARDLAKELGDPDVVSIPKVINSKIDFSSDCMGIVFPVYMFGMPLIVADFINKMPVEKGKYIYSLS
ncbi:MAG: EFR1 family ferrodoxin [Candidatus Omnitrophota bacterium]